MTGSGDEAPFELSAEDQADLLEARRVYQEQFAASRDAPPLDLSDSDKFTGPVFVDKDGNLQHPDEQTEAHRLEFKRLTEEARRNRRRS